MGPLILIVLGVLFLMANIFPETFSFSRLWPVILIVIGVVKVVESVQKRSSGSTLPGQSGPTAPSGPERKDTP